MNTSNPVTSTHQSILQPSSSNQVRASDACRQQQQQPPPPRRSSSLLPTLRRRASEPLPHGHRQRHAQRPGETHTRYTYGLNHRERCSGYTFGFTQRPSDTQTGAPREFDSNLNRETLGCRRGHTRSRTLTDMQGNVALDNARGHTYVDSQRDTDARGYRHTRSRTLDAIQCSYTDNIRAMAGQMYGEPLPHSRIPPHRHVDTHSHNYAHNRALTRHIFTAEGLKNDPYFYT